jgi:chloramphenicol-sensitive protein RarD
MPESRWIGFIIIWIALVILTVDMLRHGNARRLARAADSYEIK